MNKKKSYTISENTKSGKDVLSYIFDTPEEAVEYAVKHFNSISFILREFKSEEFFKGIFILGKLKRSTVLTRSIVIKALEEEDSE